eukprot:GHVU01085663.1.p1 GENE.GHVU01085663.1~~GHVU01085663.1.p1  ORF type:complete len:137 (-),score=6.46 GHVU01085663.1:37-447(-)
MRREALVSPHAGPPSRDYRGHRREERGGTGVGAALVLDGGTGKGWREPGCWKERREGWVLEKRVIECEKHYWPLIIRARPQEGHFVPADFILLRTWLTYICVFVSVYRESMSVSVSMRLSADRLHLMRQDDGSASD